jgi:hypothetical protein
MSRQKQYTSFVFYETFYRAIEKLPDNERLAFYDAIVKYGLYGTVPDFKGLELSIFTQIQDSIALSLARYNAGRDANRFNR